MPCSPGAYGAGAKRRNSPLVPSLMYSLLSIFQPKPAGQPANPVAAFASYNTVPGATGVGGGDRVAVGTGVGGTVAATVATRTATVGEGAGATSAMTARGTPVG